MLPKISAIKQQMYTMQILSRLQILTRIKLVFCVNVFIFGLIQF